MTKGERHARFFNRTRRNKTKKHNRAYASLRHAIVITTKPLHFRVTSYLNNKARLGGDKNSVT